MAKGIEGGRLLKRGAEDDFLRKEENQLSDTKRLREVAKNFIEPALQLKELITMLQGSGLLDRAAEVDNVSALQNSVLYFLHTNRDSTVLKRAIPDHFETADEKMHFLFVLLEELKSQSTNFN